MILYFIVSFIVAMLAAFIVLYIFHGIGLSKMLRRSGFKKPWFAFVPFCRVFALGCLADQCRDILPPKKRGHKLLYFSIAFAALNLIYIIAYGITVAEPTVEFFNSADALLIRSIESGTDIPMDEFLAISDIYKGAVEVKITTSLSVLNTLANLSVMVYELYSIFVLMRVYRIFVPRASFALTLLSIFVAEAQSIIFFVIRNKPLHNMRWQKPEERYDTPPFSM